MSRPGRGGSDRDRVRGFDLETAYTETLDLSSARCSACAYLYPYENGGGECRAEPPRILEDGVMREGGWPRVAGWDWCGAFVGRAGA